MFARKASVSARRGPFLVHYILNNFSRKRCVLKEVARGAKPKDSGMIGLMRKLFATGGLASVYKGWEATLLEDVPG